MTIRSFLCRLAPALSAAALTLCVASTAFAAPAVNLDQYRNGPPDAPITTGANWVNGNVGAQQGHYVEGYSIPYRLVMTDLPTGTPIVLVLGYDVKHSGAHAIDYLTTYNRMNDPLHVDVFGHAPEPLDPTAGVSGFGPGISTFTFPTPTVNLNVDPDGAGPAPTAPQPQTSFNNLPAGDKLMTLYGGTITNIQYDPNGTNAQGVLTAAQSEARIQVTFTVTDPTAILAWGGHIGNRNEWGLPGSPQSAGGISGSPYHMRALSWNLDNIGNQDRSLSAVAVFVPCPTCVEPSGPTGICPGSTDLTYTASFDGTCENPVYSWSFGTNTSGATFCGATNGASVCVDAGSACGSFTLNVQITCDNCADPGITCSKTVQVVDTTDPVLVGVPTGGDLGCNPTLPSCATVTATDNCDNDVQVTCTPGAITGSCLKTQIFTYTATDDCGNTASQSATYTWTDDTVPPVLVGVPTGGPLGCNPTLPVCDPAVTATDNCDTDLTVNCSPGEITGECFKSQTFTYSVADDCGNTASQSATYTWTDDTVPPVLVGVPTGGPLGCNPTLPVCDPAVTATDNCDTDLTVNCSPGEITGGCFKSQTFTYSVADDCGNTASQSATFTWTDDTTPPVLVVPPGGELGCNPPLPSCATLTATDNCDTDVPVTCTPGAITGECFKSQTFTYSAVDECGNSASGSAIFTWTDDTVPPEITCPPDATVECNTPYDPDVTGRPTVTDNCDTSILVDFDDAGLAQPDPNCAGNPIQRTWTAVDDCGNTSSCIQIISFQDTQPPTVSCPGNLSFACNEPVTFTTPSGEDDCDETPTVTCVPPSGSVFSVGTTTVTCTAVDDCENTGSCSFTVNLAGCGEGCTPGFWGGGVGATLWNTVNDPQWTSSGGDGTNPFIHTTLFNSFFTPHPTLVGLNMFQLVNAGGGSIPARKAARMLVAAYLNASFGLNYPYTPTELSNMWTTAVAGGNSALIALFNTLTAANEAGCPIGRATAASVISGDATEFSHAPGAESEGSGTDLQLYKPAPNPFSTSTRFAFSIPSGSDVPVDVAVFDLSGRRLRTLASGVRGAGRHEANWDGRDESGNRVNKGVYYIKAALGNQRRNVSVVYLR